LARASILDFDIAISLVAGIAPAGESGQKVKDNLSVLEK